MEVVAGEIYRHIAPEWVQTFGQGEPPTRYRHQVDDRAYEWAFGTEFRASNTCDPDGGVANLQATPYPLLRCSVIRELEGQFEHVPS